jgi:hypothetical protein
MLVNRPLPAPNTTGKIADAVRRRVASLEVGTAFPGRLLGFYGQRFPRGLFPT